MTSRVTSAKFLAAFFCVIVSFLFTPLTLGAAEPFDHSGWDLFLKKYVNEKGEVNYAAVAQSPQMLNDYWTRITQVDISTMESSWPREEILAFWLNAYHASLIKLVLEKYPVTSVQQIPSFWDITAFHGKGSQNPNVPKSGDSKGAAEDAAMPRFSLNQIRAQKLIESFRDEKIHLMLSLAARGGPKFPREAFTGPKVQGQLFLLTREFINNPAYVDVVPGRKPIKISPVFQWYAKDFRLDFGTPEPLGKFSLDDTAVLSFIAYYLEDEAKIEFLQEANYKIQYPAMDWSLNDWKGEAA